jgi:hypothetical protein
MGNFLGEQKFRKLFPKNRLAHRYSTPVKKLIIQAVKSVLTASI